MRTECFLPVSSLLASCKCGNLAILRSSYALFSPDYNYHDPASGQQTQSIIAMARTDWRWLDGVKLLVLFVGANYKLHWVVHEIITRWSGQQSSAVSVNDDITVWQVLTVSVQPDLARLTSSSSLARLWGDSHCCLHAVDGGGGVCYSLSSHISGMRTYLIKTGIICLYGLLV